MQSITSYFKLVEEEKHKSFLRQTYFYAWENSEDNSSKIGALIVSSAFEDIIGSGANKYPQGIKPTEEQQENKDWKYANIIHAERNAIDNAKQKKY